MIHMKENTIKTFTRVAISRVALRLFSPMLQNAFLSLSQEELRLAYADSHPIVYDGQTTCSGHLHILTDYLYYYIHTYPENLVQPICSYRIKQRDENEEYPPSFLVHKRRNSEDGGSASYLVPSTNSVVHLKLKDSNRTFVVINYIDPTVVGGDHHANRYGATIYRFQNQADMIQLIQESLLYEEEKEEESLQKNFQVFWIAKRGWSHQIIRDSQRLEQVFIKPSIKDTILERIRIFQEEKERAKRFAKPYKLNMLFYGVPGSGKTSLVKAIAKQLKKRLYIFNFSKELTDNSMSELIHEVMRNSVIVFEDVDSFFVHRESNGCNISFSSLINQLDGIKNSDAGLITILTANHVDKLDPALLRAGRIDLIVKFDYPEKDEVKMAFDAYLDHLDATKRAEMFKVWYPRVRGKQIPMSAFTDFFYRDYKQILEKTDDFIKEHEHLLSITTNSNSEKMYL